MGVPWPVHQALLTAFSFITFVLTAIPLYWHLEAWNVGCVLYIIWVSLQCLIQFVNGVIWRDNAIIWPGTKIYCDITIRYSWAFGHGVLAASLVINRRLYKIATTTSVSITRAERRRMIYVDLAIGLLPPLIHEIILWFIQGHRFDIVGGVGCTYAIPNTYMAIVFNNVVSLIIGIVSAAYCIGTLRAFLKRRRQFSELLASNKNLTFNRYIRLMALASIELLSTIPLSIFLIVYQLSLEIYVWKGLKDMHTGFSRIDQIPTIEWISQPGGVTNATLSQWLSVTCGLVFFIFFGLAEEARTHYRMAFTSVAKKLGYTSAPTSSSSGYTTGFPPSKGGSNSKFGISITIPSFITRSVNRRGSISSFSDKLSTSISVGDMDFEDIKEKPYSPATSFAGSSTCVSSPIDGVPAPTRIDFPRPDSAIVADTLAHRHTPDVPAPIHHSDFIV